LSCQILYTGGLYHVLPKRELLWSRDIFKFLVPLRYLRNG